MRKLFTISILMLVFSSANADNLINIVEYKIPSQDLVTFSSSELQARLCPDCSISKLTIPSTNVLHEQSTPVSLKRATELFVSRPYSHISVFVNRQQSRVEKLVFGQISEIESDRPLSTPNN